MPTVTGPDLRRERRADEFTVTEVADLIGVSRQTLHVIERSADPGPERVGQYREALDRLRAVKVSARGEATA